MSIPHLKWAKDLKEQGKRLGRAGMSQRVLSLVEDFIKNDGSYKGAMELAGRLKAISQAANCDTYWSEKVGRGYHKELYEITKFEPEPVKED